MLAVPSSVRRFAARLHRATPVSPCKHSPPLLPPALPPPAPPRAVTATSTPHSPSSLHPPILHPAVTAILKAGGGPEAMVTIAEGEALLNDASAVTLYTGEAQRGEGLGRGSAGCGHQMGRGWRHLARQPPLLSSPAAPAVFLHILMASASEGIPSVPSEIWPIIRDILKCVLGGTAAAPGDASSCWADGVQCHPPAGRALGCLAPHIDVPPLPRPTPCRPPPIPRLAAPRPRLTGIGVGIGLAFAWALGYVLRLLRWRGARAYIESLVVLAAAYLAFYVAQVGRAGLAWLGRSACGAGWGWLVVLAAACLAFYVAQVGSAGALWRWLRLGVVLVGGWGLLCSRQRAPGLHLHPRRLLVRASCAPLTPTHSPDHTSHLRQGPAKGSGVIAVCVFGLYGSASGRWGMLATDAASGVHEAVWDTVAFAGACAVAGLGWPGLGWRRGDGEAGAGRASARRGPLRAPPQQPLAPSPLPSSPPPTLHPSTLPPRSQRARLLLVRHLLRQLCGEVRRLPPGCGRSRLSWVASRASDGGVQPAEVLWRCCLIRRYPPGCPADPPVHRHNHAGPPAS